MWLGFSFSNLSAFSYLSICLYLRAVRSFLRVGLSHLDTIKNVIILLIHRLISVSALRDVEDTSHFLLVCPLFITHRETLTANINEILKRNNVDFIVHIELYLYGHSSLKKLYCQKILAATIEYIESTNRLSTLILPLTLSSFFYFIWSCCVSTFLFF